MQSASDKSGRVAVDTAATTLVGELTRANAVSPEQLAKAEELVRERGGLLSSHLAKLGVAPQALRNALAAATALPAAPTASLASPDTRLGQRLKAAQWRALKAVPFAERNGTLYVAFADPAMLSGPAGQQLPPHVAYVALESEVLQAFQRVFGPALPAPGQRTPTGATPAAPAMKATPSVQTPPLSERGPTTGAPSVTPSASAASAPTALPQRIGDFPIERLLGEGGMASVYLGKEPQSGRPVAVKVMQAHLARDADFVARFAHEAKANLGLRHEHIVQVVAFGEDQGRYYIVSELMDGGTVEALLQRHRPLPLPVVLEIFSQLLAGIGHAHSKGVVHRDLKPANLLLASSGTVKLADFGIAKTLGGSALTQTGATLGTPAYMSPEQAAGKPLDGRSDLFAAGVVLYELLTGTNPHQGTDPVSCLTRLLRGRTPGLRELDPSVPDWLEALVARLLEREAEHRFPNAEAVLEALGPHLTLLRRRHPDALKAFLANPQSAGEAMREARRLELWNEAERLSKLGATDRRRALMLLNQACAVSPSHRATRERFQALCAAEGVRADEPTDRRVAELRQKLDEAPDSAELALELAQLYRQHANVFRAVALYRRYLRLRPDDAGAAGQLALLLGERAASPSAAATRSPAPAQDTASAFNPSVDEAAPTTRASGSNRSTLLAAVAVLALAAAGAGWLALRRPSAASTPTDSAESAEASTTDPSSETGTDPAASAEATSKRRSPPAAGDEQVRRLLEREEAARKERARREEALRQAREGAAAERERAAREAAERGDEETGDESSGGGGGGVPYVPSIPGGGFRP